MKNKNKITFSLIIIISILILIIVFIFMLNGIKDPVAVEIENIKSEPAEFGDGRTLFINITFKNNEEETAWISNPMIITDTDRELFCNFINVNKSIDFSPGKVELRSKECIRATIKTWDKKSFCYCLLLNEKPAYFEYSYGSGIVFSPKIFKIKIPNQPFYY